MFKDIFNAKAGRMTDAEVSLWARASNTGHDPRTAVSRAKLKALDGQMNFQEAADAVIAEIEHQALYNCPPA